MKLTITSLLLASAALITFAGCKTPGKTTANRIIFDGQTYPITAAGTDFEGAVFLYFKAGSEDDDAWFALHLGEGEFRITESATFTFAAEGTGDYGKPGTFSEGGFEKGTTEAAVTAGTVKVTVSGDTYDIEADCTCDGGRKLTVTYSGPLEYEVPAGTSTFIIDGTEFPFASAEIYSDGWNKEYGLYITEIEILGFNAADNRMLDCELAFFHSGANLAGTYDIAQGKTTPGLFYGELYLDDYGSDDDFGGIMADGQVTVGIAGDIYTITLDGVKLYTENGLIDVAGAYTGPVKVMTGSIVKFASPERLSGHPEFKPRK